MRLNYWFPLHESYSSLQDFLDWDSIYSISKRLGFNSPMDAWNANPHLCGSTDPGDLQVCKLHYRTDDVTVFSTKNELIINCNGEVTAETIEEFFEPVIANSELDWIDPAETGDLTAAPMIGIRGPEVAVEKGQEPFRITSMNNGQAYYEPVLERWAYMSYAVRDPMEEIKSGYAVFTNEDE